jgi:hypothetical protein
MQAKPKVLSAVKPKYAASRERAWWQKAKPQFWIVLALLSLLSLAGIYATGRFMFRTVYAPLPVEDGPLSGVRQAATETLTPTAAMTATPDGAAPWMTQMVPIDNSQSDMPTADRAVYKYDLPQDARDRLEADWKDIIDHFYTLPPYRWKKDPSLIAKYTWAQHLKATPTGAPTATAVPQGATVNVGVPGQRVVTLLGCDDLGTTCQIRDIWSNITTVTYDYWQDKVVASHSNSGSVAYTVTLKWKDGRWKLQSVTGKVVRYVTATPGK